MWFSGNDAILLQSWHQVIHGHDVLLFLWSLLVLGAGRDLAGRAHLAVLQGIIGYVREELLGCKGYEADQSGQKYIKVN